MSLIWQEKGVSVRILPSGIIISHNDIIKVSFGDVANSPNMGQYIGKVRGFRFSGNNDPTSIFINRWRENDKEWGSQYEIVTYRSIIKLSENYLETHNIDVNAPIKGGCIIA